MARVLRADRPDLSDEEVERWRIATVDQFQRGDLMVSSGWDGEVRGMFWLADKIPKLLLSEMVWTVLRAPESAEFIIADHPVHMYDPNSIGGAAWFSSDQAQVTLPIAFNTCLVLQPGPAHWRDVTISEEAVRDLNLKAYAGAERRIYGRSQGLLQKVRAAAKQRRDVVDAFQPRPPAMILSERMEGARAPFRIDARPAPLHPEIRRFRRSNSESP